MPKYKAAGNKATQTGPLLIRPTAEDNPQNGPRIGTKLTQNATTTQSTGGHVAQPHHACVAHPTAALMTVIVSR
jgi:hypothetical protein